ncbi:GNAT family N-acetyltransferase [Thalassobacillus pellis]|uniref:GNAT family N-acetyltransferase n=1 Tax=Thalassobacillus pellis TaxID=748008 RepID=UPI00195F40EE|nr:GNAT family N-acetyltransferase [Thalassobacillus pellis]MBM7554320.1 putative GNAT family acetyltransferase [Thalassobacillus pellis]
MAEIKQAPGRFYVGSENDADAEITFNEKGNSNYVIASTVVNDKLQGEGIGSQLVHRVVEHARQQDKKIEPACSFARKKFEDTPEYEDVWEK